MVYKTRFLKKRIEDSYDPSADGTYSWELTDEALSAIWITIKADLVADEHCVDDVLGLVSEMNVWFGGFNVVHYLQSEKCVVMNSKLKGNRPMLLGNGMDTDDVKGVAFPILFGAPYINEKMALPRSLSNRKTLDMTVDIANADADDLLIDICEVVLPDARPVGFIKQEQKNVSAQGTGDNDIWLQTNWDLLKLLIHAPTVPVDDAWTCTVNRAGLEIDDFSFGYQGVPWEILHGEIMDELGGMMGIENHFHDDPSSGVTGYAEDLEHYIRYYAELDFFHEHDLKWRAPLSQASTAKLKLNYGVDEAIQLIQANYVPVNKMEAKPFQY